MSAEPNGAAGEHEKALQETIDKLRKELEEERSRGFLRRLFGLRPRTAEDTESTREKMRGRLAIALVLTLIVVMLLTFAYLVMLSRNFGELTMDEIVSVIPMVGTTLLTPLVGLIGAVTGFYFGGQVAAQATHATQVATHEVMEMTIKASKQKAGQSDDPSGTVRRPQ